MPAPALAWNVIPIGTAASLVLHGDLPSPYPGWIVRDRDLVLRVDSEWDVEPPHEMPPETAFYRVESVAAADARLEGGQVCAFTLRAVPGGDPSDD